ncbi:hypothetical protein KIP75_30310 [Pseudomonas aeruginosa]|uniref:hypothetical protein n=1 Tax=Pseudomonas aeruginosa TaxID=287 RepID=UPI001BFFA439|nr:hypothetical protein [Pseudomonas aeruginosa]MBT9112110.1 hypothetical protein [Pseudomonas aeruginosa]MBT9117852.1 hypothetical protein [Pseudomonas aeruginosa]MBT9123876.1 hypothetical protein [Pseudomonas aeruginosa]
MNQYVLETDKSLMNLEHVMSGPESVLGDESLYHEAEQQSDLFFGDEVGRAEPEIGDSVLSDHDMDDFDRGLNAPTDGDHFQSYQEALSKEEGPKIESNVEEPTGEIESEELGDFVELDDEEAAKLNANPGLAGDGVTPDIAESLADVMGDEASESPEETFHPDFLSPAAFARSGRPLSDLNEQAQARRQADEFDELYGPNDGQQARSGNGAGAAVRAAGNVSLGAGLVQLTSAVMNGIGRTISAGGAAATSMIHDYRFNTARAEFDQSFAAFSSQTKTLQEDGLAVLATLDDELKRAEVLEQFLEQDGNREKLGAVYDAITDMEIKAKRLAKAGIRAGHDEADVYKMTGERISRYLNDNEKFLKAVEQNGKSLADRLGDSVVSLLEMLKNAMAKFAEFFLPSQQEQQAPASSPRLG